MTLFRAQKILAAIGYPIVVDGTRSRSTSSCLADFQRKNGLGASGELDAETMSALERVEEHAVAYHGPSKDEVGAEEPSSSRSGLWYFVGGAAIFGAVGFLLGRKGSRSWSEIFEPSDDEVMRFEFDEESVPFAPSKAEWMDEEDFE